MEKLPLQLADVRSTRWQKIAGEGTFLVVCRYASLAMLNWLDRHEGQISGVALLVDDDIPALVTGSEASLPYRFFLFRKALVPLPRLSRHLDIIWASTDTLAGRIGNDGTVLPPAPPLEMCMSRQHDRDGHQVKIAYHATSIHNKEHVFLRPIVADVLQRCPRAHFEVVADGGAARMWSGMERVRVVKPLAWDEYLRETSQTHVDILLVPLLDSLVNRSRSDAKRIDAARMGAAPIYSASNAYGRCCVTEELRIPNTFEDWVHHVLLLINDTASRQTHAAIAKERAIAMSLRAEAGLFEAGRT
ncbi:hypothetical protein BTE77_26335 [Ensifer adhaerens]|nr:hypothetical protein BTE77_26335 [Ensifer adhaerens]